MPASHPGFRRGLLKAPGKTLRRRQTMFASLALGAGLASGAWPRGSRAEKRTDCGYPEVSIAYSDAAELEIACGALADVGAYFRRAGFDIAPKFSLHFADRSAAHSFSQLSSHGYFNARQLQIVVYRTSDVSAWGLPWSQGLAISFLHHELAHMATWQVTDGDFTRLRREWHEFIAYVVQFDLMNPTLRADLLAKQSQVHAFDHLMQINEFTYHMNPEVFAVAAYKMHLARGGAHFVGQLLRGEIVPPPLSYPFAVVPGQK